MAVFVYRGLLVATGKQVSGVRDADNPKGCTAASTRDAASPAARCRRPYASIARRFFFSPFPLMVVLSVKVVPIRPR